MTLTRQNMQGKRLMRQRRLNEGVKLYIGSPPAMSG